MDWERLIRDADEGSRESLQTICKTLERKGLTGAVYRILHKEASKDISRSLGRVHPHLLDLWHPTKNVRDSIYDLAVKSPTKVWWKCPRGPDHEWVDAPKNMRTDSSCPFCRGRKVAFSDSVAGRNPEVAKTWLHSENGAKRPNNTSRFSKDPVWWKCPEGHEFQRSPWYRCRSSSQCPECYEIQHMEEMEPEADYDDWW